MWADDVVETPLRRLELLAEEGFNARKISELLSALLGRNITKNAIGGAAHRHGVKLHECNRGSVSDRAKCRRALRKCKRKLAEPKPAPTLVHEPVPEPQPAELELTPVLDADPMRVTIEALESGMCRWPINEPGEPGFRFCGRKTPDRKSYCEAHERRSLQPSHPRRDRALEYWGK